MISVLHTA